MSSNENDEAFSLDMMEPRLLELPLGNNGEIEDNMAVKGAIESNYAPPERGGVDDIVSEHVAAVQVQRTSSHTAHGAPKSNANSVGHGAPKGNTNAAKTIAQGRKPAGGRPPARGQPSKKQKR